MEKSIQLHDVQFLSQGDSSGKTLDGPQTLTRRGSDKETVHLCQAMNFDNPSSKVTIVTVQTGNGGGL